MHSAGRIVQQVVLFSARKRLVAGGVIGGAVLVATFAAGALTMKIKTDRASKLAAREDEMQSAPVDAPTAPAEGDRHSGVGVRPADAPVG